MTVNRTWIRQGVSLSVFEPVLNQLDPTMYTSWQTIQRKYFAGLDISRLPSDGSPDIFLAPALAFSMSSFFVFVFRFLGSYGLESKRLSYLVQFCACRLESWGYFQLISCCLCDFWIHCFYRGFLSSFLYGGYYFIKRVSVDFNLQCRCTLFSLMALSMAIWLPVSHPHPAFGLLLEDVKGNIPWVNLPQLSFFLHHLYSCRNCFNGPTLSFGPKGEGL